MLLYHHRGHLTASRSILSPNTALAHVKTRALLSIEPEASLNTYQGAKSGVDSRDRARPIVSNALVTVGSAEVTSELEESVKKWRKWRKLMERVAHNVPTPHVCSCPGGNETRSVNLTNVKL